MNKYKKRNYYYGKGGGLQLPIDTKIENTKFADNTKYSFVGTFREYTPLARTITDFNNDLVLEIRKDTRKSKTDFDVIPNINTGGGYHGSDFNNNGGFRISKQVLQEIVDGMDDVDELIITAPDSLNRKEFDITVNEIKQNMVVRGK